MIQCIENHIIALSFGLETPPTTGRGTETKGDADNVLLQVLRVHWWEIARYDTGVFGLGGFEHPVFERPVCAEEREERSEEDAFGSVSEERGDLAYHDPEVVGVGYEVENYEPCLR